MKIVFHTNSVSPHQIPLAREIVKRIGAENYRYIYTAPLTDERRNLGWSTPSERWIVCEKDAAQQCQDWLENCDVLMSGLRDVDLFERRDKSGRKSFYVSERWFKRPIGLFRLLSFSYLLVAFRIAQLLKKGDGFMYFPMGVHAARDMVRLCGLLHGDLRCLFRAPNLEFEKKLGGKIWLKDGGYGKRYCLNKMRMWGYCVEPSKFDVLPVLEVSKSKSQETRVLWVGRLLSWKRVDTIVRAVGEHASLKRVDDSLPKITLDIYGAGPEERRLKKLAMKYGDVIKFFPTVQIADVRKLMQEHDIYVLGSNAYEGWGAVVSEALEEGMKVLGTYEAGSSATMIPEENLFHAGDWQTLEKLLSNDVNTSGIGSWTVSSAATFVQRQITRR